MKRGKYFTRLCLHGNGAADSNSSDLVEPKKKFIAQPTEKLPEGGSGENEYYTNTGAGSSTLCLTAGVYDREAKFPP